MGKYDESGPTASVKMGDDQRETDVFISQGNGKKSRKSRPREFLLKRGVAKCFGGCGILGVILLLVGIMAIISGKTALESKILKSMALSPGSDRFESWLRPPVQPHLSAYAFHVTNPDEVLRGAKPVVKEVGPFVYKSVTLKDTDETLVWSPDDAKVTYRPRKIYSFVPELSEIKDPDTTFVTVPNIPLWTVLHSLRNKGDSSKGVGIDVIEQNGLGTPFINVSLSGLLWGYEDELPCLKQDMPAGCETEDSPFSSSDDDDGGWGDDDGWGDDSFEEEEEETTQPKKKVESEWDKLVKPKAEFIDCKCRWGLFRDRNVTLRQSIEFFTGVSDLAAKGNVVKYDGKKHLGWWKKDSICDRVRGRDSSTFPPSITPDFDMEIFIDLMCRPIDLRYEMDTEHAGITSYRFVPPQNALGHHNDTNPEFKNEANECYCLKDENFDCFKSGVYNMEPCKRDTHAPLALSYPHFYQADPSFREAVGGLKPEKEKHQFFVDVVPEFGFPLAIRPRFQLNLVIGAFPDWEPVKMIKDKIVLPFLWAQDGFDEPSVEMASAIAFGLKAPALVSSLIASVCFVLGALCLLLSIVYFMWKRKSGGRRVIS